jgi:hypothetical protein
VRRRDRGQTAVTKTLECGDKAGWALWRLSQVLREVAQNQPRGVNEVSGSQITNDTESSVYGGEK